MNLASTLRDIVARSFQVSQESYAAELAAHNQTLDLTGDVAFRSEVRPKFFTGNPNALKPGSYLLDLSLNHKYKTGPGIDEEIAALNAGPAEHYESCANYFERGRVYPFFRKIVPVLEGMGLRPATLGVRVFFMDALPFFSIRSNALSSGELQMLGGTIVELNREAVKAVITEIRPAALFINGQTAFSALAAGSDGPVDWRSHALVNTTQAGTCRVESAHVQLFGVTVHAVRSNFLRSVYGPNSREQCLEVGELLAATG